MTPDPMDRFRTPPAAPFDKLASAIGPHIEVCKRSERRIVGFLLGLQEAAWLHSALATYRPVVRTAQTDKDFSPDSFMGFPIYYTKAKTCCLPIYKNWADASLAMYEPLELNETNT